MVVHVAINCSYIALAGYCFALMLWAPTVQATQGTAEDFTAPKPIGATHVTYPVNAPPHATAISVIVSIQINDAGEVEQIQLLQSGGRVFDQAVLVAASHFSFEPALYLGKPHASAIRYTANFPAPKAKSVKTVEHTARTTLSGKALERGTRRLVLDGQVIASHSSHATERRLLDNAGFSLKLQPGNWTVEVKAPGFAPFIFEQEVGEDDLFVNCLLERKTYNEYEEVVIGKRVRVEVSRTSLRGREIHRVPGTFGDPFKVTNTMPGVSQLMSLMPLPVIRGVGPSQSGFLFDSIALPLFYHSLAGPSVIHPAFIDRIDFFPGNPSAQYGGYTGGIVNGVSKLPFQSTESAYSIDLNLIQGGGFIREHYQAANTEVMAAARIGYPDGILSLLNSQTRLSYWDYQTRIAWGDRNFFLSAMFLGARDKLVTVDSKYEDGEVVEFSEPTLWAEFHKIILRMRHQSAAFTGNYHLALSYDLSALESAEPSAKSLGIAPHLDWRWDIIPSLTLVAGLEAEFRELSLLSEQDNQADPNNPTQFFLTEATQGLHKEAGSWLSLTYKPTRDWLITPGVRVDVYSNEDLSHWAVQPRLQIKGRMFKRNDQSLWLKVASGVYQQPPRPYLMLPGLNVTALDLGLLKSYQNMVGAEWQLNSEWSLDVQAYYNHLDPTLFELNLSENQEEQTEPNPYEPPPDPNEPEWITGVSYNSMGRAYGLEVMIRKEGNGQFFGWLSYALSRSERLRGEDYIAYDFDRTHIINLVTGVKLSGNWEIGSRLVFQTGTPLTTDNGGVASGRSASNWRIDLRIDKRIVFNEWLLDFYVEILNVAVNRESGGLIGKEGFRYVLPTLGLRAIL